MIFPSNLLTDSESDFGEGDFFCVEGIVARNDDPENRCRVQLVFPQFDDDVIHEIWARRFQLYVGENGFGDYFVPERGTEVLAIGRFGDSNSLFYAPLWNESIKPSNDFPDKTVLGVRVPENLKLIAGQVAKILAKGIELIAVQMAKISAQNIEINAEQSAKMKGENTSLEATSTIQVKGATVKISGDGSISITGGSISIGGDVVRIHNRIVNKVGGAI